jgi:hypothetical protein
MPGRELVLVIQRFHGLRSLLVVPGILMLGGIVVMIGCLLAENAAPTWLGRGAALMTVSSAVLELLTLQAYARCP